MKQMWLTVVALLLAGACAEQETQPVRVLMETSLGKIKLELYPDRAPVTVANFLQLVDGEHLAGGSFYRTVSPENDNGSPVIAVIQGGIGDAESPLPPIAHEKHRSYGAAACRWQHFDGAVPKSARQAPSSLFASAINPHSIMGRRATRTDRALRYSAG